MQVLAVLEAAKPDLVIAAQILVVALDFPVGLGRVVGGRLVRIGELLPAVRRLLLLGWRRPSPVPVRVGRSPHVYGRVPVLDRAGREGVVDGLRHCHSPSAVVDVFGPQ